MLLPLLKTPTVIQSTFPCSFKKYTFDLNKKKKEIFSSVFPKHFSLAMGLNQLSNQTIDTNSPFIELERGSGQIAPSAHASASPPVRGLRREQPRAAPPPRRQILRVEIHFRRLLLCIRRRRARRDRRRRDEFRQCLVVPCSGAHFEQGDRRGSVLASFPRLTLVKQGEQVTERRLVRPILPPPRSKLHFLRLNVYDLIHPSTTRWLLHHCHCHRGLGGGDTRVRPNVVFRRVADHFEIVVTVARLLMLRHFGFFYSWIILLLLLRLITMPQFFLRFSFNFNNRKIELIEFFNYFKNLHYTISF